MKWRDIQKEVKTMEGKTPKSDHAVRNAVSRGGIARGVVTNNYENCGRRYGEDGGKHMITPQQEKDLVQFVKKWRNKKFCTCKYIKRELKLEATPRTIARALNRNGYKWCQVSRKSPLTAKQLQQRKVWVKRYLHKSPTWWTQNMHLIFDGVTLTKAPQESRPETKACCPKHSTHVDEDDREDGPHTAHLQQVWGSVGNQSAFVGRFHRGWLILLEAVDRKAQDEERGVGAIHIPIEESSCNSWQQCWHQEIQDVA